MQLFSASEKQQMTDLINTMIAYNLTYHQERNVEGQYSYSLDPYVNSCKYFNRGVGIDKLHSSARSILMNRTSTIKENFLHKSSKNPKAVGFLPVVRF